MPRFATLWSNHPNIKGDAQLLDKKVYDNQCAINMSAAWLRSGMKLSGFTGALSWQRDQPRYAIRAQELANWFASPWTHLSKLQKFTGKEVSEQIGSKTGIIFLQNYWGVRHQDDHIDLWNGSRLTGLNTWTRIHLHLSWEGWFSNLKDSQAVWFCTVP